jgi:hypothetical protein
MRGEIKVNGNILECKILNIIWDILIDSSFFASIFFILKAHTIHYLLLHFLMIISFPFYFLVKFRYFPNLFGNQQLILGEREERETYKVFRIVFAPERDMQSRGVKLLEFFSTRNEENMVRFILSRMSFIIYMSKRRNMILIFRETIYLILSIVVLLGFEWKIYVSLIFYTISVLLMSLLIKVYIVADKLRQLLDILYYIDKLSSQRFSQFYIHPTILRLLEIYLSKGVSSLLLEGVSFFFPFMQMI